MRISDWSSDVGSSDLSTLDGVVAAARLDDEVDLHRRIDLDVVVAVAGAHGELLAPRQRHVVLLAVDVEAQLAVLALGDLDLVVAVAGLEHELVGKHPLVRASVRERVCPYG